MELGRLLTAMVTPFDDQGRVDYAQAKRLARALLDSGSDGVVVSGTTGESPTLSREEKLKLFAEVRSVVARPHSVIVGTGSYNTAESIELTKEAKHTGADAVLAVVPYYNRPTQDGLFLHFKAIAEEGGMPCMVYNVPSRTVTNLAPETMVRLSKVHNIAGVKEASGNLDQIAKIISGAGKSFPVWSGNDSDTLPIMALGGHGVVSVASHLVGKQIKRMMQDIVGGRIEDAAALHCKLLPLVNALFLIGNPMPLKLALNYAGFNVGKCRLPLTEPDDRTAAAVKAALGECVIDLPVR